MPALKSFIQGPPSVSPTATPAIGNLIKPATGGLMFHLAVPLRLLSYNIQTGIATSGYRQYLTQSWKHILPYRRRTENLDRIARIVGDYDIVGLQEADAGSLRSEFINQVKYLADQARFPYWYFQTNRHMGRIAQGSTGLLSRFPLGEVTGHRLPGMIPGRGALVARFGEEGRQLVLVISHLALGRRTRMRQVGYISELVRSHPHVILMGDLNCRPESPEMAELLKRTGLKEPARGLYTFPSWSPHKNIDHILVSPSMEVVAMEVLECRFSDHLPISARIELPINVLSSDNDTTSMKELRVSLL